MIDNVVLYIWEYDDTNTRFNRVGIIEIFESLIWINKYNDTGNFELYIPANAEILALLTSGEIHYITRADKPENAMKVEKVELTTSDENGDHITITGRSAECILAQRVFLSSVLYQQTTIQNAVLSAVYNNFIYTKSESYEFRIIPIITYDPNLDTDGYIQPVAYANNQYNTESILDAVVDMCQYAGYGFKVTFSPTALTFYIYVGVNRTINQTANKRVVFSPDYNNLANTTYTYDITSYFNLCQALGDGTGATQYKTWTKPTGLGGMALIEKSVASGISKSIEGGEMSDAQYMILLQRFATKERTRADITRTFDADILNFNAYTYGVDYNLGDIVTAINEYGISGSARVTEISEVFDESGYKIYPTLSEWSV